MKKLMILCAACLTALCAMAQTIDAIKVTQGETTDWYPFGESSRIEVTIDDLGNLEFPGGTMYDLSLNGNVYTAFGTAPIEKITLTAEDFSVTKDGDWVYDKTEKRVKVELINPEYIMPPADKITIYYNNDKMVKPINPGTYQVYIDIEETEKYAAVTLTSEAWQFEIINQKGSYTREGLSDGKIGTICLAYAVDDLTDVSAKFFTLNYFDRSESKLYIEEVTTLEAGMPYIFEATAEAFVLEYIMTDPAAANHYNGLYGALEQVEKTSDSEHSYAAISNNQVNIVDIGYTITVAANRAYIDMNEVATSEQSHAAPLRALGVSRGQTTELKMVDGSQCTMHNGKYIYKGRFVIVRDNKMFNAQGNAL